MGVKLGLSHWGENTWAEGVWEQGAEGDIGIQEGLGNKGVEKTT